MEEDTMNTAQWTNAIGYARQSCARVFRDGGTPADALATFGLKGRQRSRSDWGAAVEDIASALCQPRRA